MAFVDQGLKQKLAPSVKKVLAKYGMKGSLSVRHHSTLVLKLKSGKIDFEGSHIRRREIEPSARFMNEEYVRRGHMGVNHYHLDSNFEGVALKFLEEVKAAMSQGNWDRSDLMTDYFDIGWYLDIKVGEWNKPYILEK